MMVLACPRCLSKLTVSSGGCGCARCGPYPVLGGVPILVPDPAGWCATFHDAALAALAEHGLAGRADVARLEAFAAAAPVAEPSRFGDDWAAHELAGDAPPRPVSSPVDAPLAALLDAAEACAPARWLLARVPRGARVLEVGCGAGQLSERLSRAVRAPAAGRRGARTRGARLVVADLSLRAVLAARARGHADLGVVLDAAALPFPRDAFDLIVAEDVVDLLDEPLAFLEAARRVAPRLLLTTPDPWPAAVRRQLLARARLREEARADGLPWLRQVSARHLQLYLVQALGLARMR